LPLAWAAATQGLAGAMFGAALLQVGVILGVEWLGYSAISVLEVQVLAVVLALFGFFLGVVVDEKERLSQELRQTLRLAAAGEMAGALAHELNQPLTALAAYGAACEAMLAGGDASRLREVVGRMVAESARAAEVVRRLRDFFRTGATQLEAVALGELLQPVLATFRAKAERAGIEFVADDATVPPADGAARTLLADRLQLEVVLRNLLTNAFEAVEDEPAGARRVCLRIEMASPDSVCLSVEDSGPGLSEAQVARLFEAFQSSKSRGLGLGLVISRAIVDNHGGRLWAEAGSGGVFRMVLPVEEETNAA
ncbi:MAG TPA: ATP-binding protein, partial [Azospira sp.]|nr:ATP-binding protein [Azospira sp.]